MAYVQPRPNHHPLFPLPLHKNSLDEITWIAPLSPSPLSSAALAFKFEIPSGQYHGSGYHHSGIKWDCNDDGRGDGNRPIVKGGLALKKEEGGKGRGELFVQQEHATLMREVVDISLDEKRSRVLDMPAEKKFVEEYEEANTDVSLAMSLNTVQRS